MRWMSSVRFCSRSARVAQTYRSDYEVAAGHEKALTDGLMREQSVAVAANHAQVQLRQLEQKAESYNFIRLFCSALKKLRSRKASR